MYDLTEGQRHASGCTVSAPIPPYLSAAQQLYEQRKVIGYPRTDSRHLSPGCRRHVG
ncbi:MAG: hypothetical protein R3F37_09775 [Candidatus Competibacteraceae bacterium]